MFYVASGNFTSTGSDCGAACKYLEAAPSDHSSKVAWCSDTSNLLSVTATGIGSGMSNTTKADQTCTSGAIQVAADYNNNNKTAWFLPSRDDLNELCKIYSNGRTDTTVYSDSQDGCTGNRSPIGGYSDGAYASSSESYASYAWWQNFGWGYRSYWYKDYTFYVRPVRAF